MEIIKTNHSTISYTKNYSDQKKSPKTFTITSLTHKKLFQTNQKTNQKLNNSFQKPFNIGISISRKNSLLLESLSSTPKLKKNLFTLENSLAFNTTTKKNIENIKIPFQNFDKKFEFLNKKRKILTSEEIELQKIEKERNEAKKIMEKNRSIYYKSLNFTPMAIIPKPLTTFKPFNLSSNLKSKYLKERQGNTLYEINKLNQKIREKMQQKIETMTDTKTKNQILLNNADCLKKQNFLYKDIENQKKKFNFFCINYCGKNTQNEEQENNLAMSNFLTPQKNAIIENNNSVISKLVMSNSKISKIFLNYLNKK